MLAEIERNRQDFDTPRLAVDYDLALQLWEERGALINPEDLSREMSELLNEVAGSINEWGQDHRDAALGLIEALAIRTQGLPLLNGEQQAEIGRSYINVVESLSSEADWLG